LVTFSGGKGLLGPQCAGLLLGRPDLIEAGRQAISPHGGIGRGMKVGKEEMIGVLAAVERYLKVDHEAERRELEERAAHVLGVLAKVSGVKAERHIPEIANEVPHVKIEWEGKRTAKEVVQQLIEGEPPIAVSQRGERGLVVSMWMLRGDEHKVVARRLREMLI
jgi:L-seryl-tRNA(Ser) seleniumtransferase